jgi:hypothetical protein
MGFFSAGHPWRGLAGWAVRGAGLAALVIAVPEESKAYADYSPSRSRSSWTEFQTGGYWAVEGLVLLVGGAIFDLATTRSTVDRAARRAESKVGFDATVTPVVAPGEWTGLAVQVSF